MWLHWNYTYGGDNRIVRLKDVTFGYKSRLQPTFAPLAKRTGAFGTLVKQSPISGPLNGRVDVIPDNSTLVVHNLQFNDSGSNFTMPAIILYHVNPNIANYDKRVEVIGESYFANESSHFAGSPQKSISSKSLNLRKKADVKFNELLL